MLIESVAIVTFAIAEPIPQALKNGDLKIVGDKYILSTVESGISNAAIDRIRKLHALGERRVKSSTEVVRPLAYGVLKIKGKLGRLMPAEQGKRNDKLPKAALGSCEFTAPTISAYRKIGAHQKLLDEYYDACEVKLSFGKNT